MEILVLTDYYQPGNNRVQERQALHLAELGHDVTLIGGNSNPETLDTGRLDGVRHIPFHYDPGRSLPTQAMQFYSSLHTAWDRAYGSHPPQGVIMNQPLSAWLLQARLAETDRRLYCFHAPWGEEWIVHNPPPANPVLRALKWPWRTLNRISRQHIEDKVLEVTDGIVVLSEFMRDQLLTAHPELDPDRVHKIPGGVDPEKFHPAPNRTTVRNKLDLAEGRWILSVRRLVDRMGLDRLIEALGRAKTDTNGEPIRLLIVGHGPEKKQLQALAEDVAPGRVRFEGYVEDDRLPLYYQAADLFVLPTRKLEGFGLVTVEALASGLPVLATPVGGTTEVLEPFDDGMFLPAYEPGAWAERIRQALDGPASNPNYRERCRQYAKESFSWHRGVEYLNEQFFT